MNSASRPSTKMTGWTIVPPAIAITSSTIPRISKSMECFLSPYARCTGYPDRGPSSGLSLDQPDEPSAARACGKLRTAQPQRARKDQGPGPAARPHAQPDPRRGGRAGPQLAQDDPAPPQLAPRQ